MDCLLLIANYVGTVSNRDCTFSYREKILKDGFSQFHRCFSPEKIAVFGNGKPYVVNDDSFFFNLSNTYLHEKGVSDSNQVLHCIAGAFAQTEIGVDIEYERNFSPAVTKRCFSLDEQNHINHVPYPNQERTILWTLKESYVKYTGLGLSSSMADYSFLFDPIRQRYFLSLDPSLFFYQMKMDNGLFVSICTNRELNIITKSYR